MAKFETKDISETIYQIGECEDGEYRVFKEKITDFEIRKIESAIFSGKTYHEIFYTLENGKMIASKEIDDWFKSDYFSTKELAQAECDRRNGETDNED